MLIGSGAPGADLLEFSDETGQASSDFLSGPIV